MTEMTNTTNSAVRPDTAMTTGRGATNGTSPHARDAGRSAGKLIEANPLAVIAGGIAIGLAAGALLPKTKRETELLGPVGKRLTGAAAGAADAARDAARAELASLPLNRETARAQVTKLIGQVAKAVSSAGDAALNNQPDAPIVKKSARKAK